MNFLFAHSPCETLLFDDIMVELHDYAHWENTLVVSWFSLLFSYLLPDFARMSDAFGHRFGLNAGGER